MEENVISNMLSIALIVLIAVLMLLSIIYIILRVKSKKPENPNEGKISDKKLSTKGKDNSKKNTSVSTSYTKESIFDFMEFDGVEDNMIIQKNGKRFIMVIECQGINYDLMSKMEKISVEEGFQQFLNTLTRPIQIYIQTRTINLESSITTYNSRVKDIENKYRKMLFEYNTMRKSGNYTAEELSRYYYELTKQRNLLEYGQDIIANTEKMSLNRNVLNKKYYIIIHYYAQENENNYDKEEIRNNAFSELYTNAQGLIRTLSACSIGGKILNSKELVDLLYMAYNRDEAEIFGINKALAAQYDSLYSTSQDVFEKKLRVLDEIVQEKAIDLANEKIEKVRTDLQKKAEEKENSMERLVQAMAKVVLRENRGYVGGAVADKAIEEIDKDNEEGGSANEEEVKKTTRGRKRKSVNE